MRSSLKLNNKLGKRDNKIRFIVALSNGMDDQNNTSIFESISDVKAHFNKLGYKNNQILQIGDK